MTNHTLPARIILAAALVASAAAAARAVGQSPFDDAGKTPAVSLSSLKFVAAPKASAQPAAYPQAVPRPASDLFYFSPGEAAAARRLPQPFSVPDGNWSFDANVPPAVQQQLVGDLAFIKTIQGAKASPLHRAIFGSVDGGDYYRFFASRVTKVGMNDCGSANAVACVIPWLGSSKIWLTQNYVRFSHPQIARLMVVFHETRHTEVANGNWSHATCPRPFPDPRDPTKTKPLLSIWTGAPLAGEPACDATPLGSYGSSTIMLKNIQLYCSNCSELVRAAAKLYSDDQFLRITNPRAQEEMRRDLQAP